MNPLASVISNFFKTIEIVFFAIITNGICRFQPHKKNFKAHRMARVKSMDIIQVIGRNK